jgi:hypothetical protein
MGEIILRAQIIKIRGFQKNKIYYNIGKEAFKYKGKRYYTGDAIVVYDKYELPNNTIIIEKENKTFIYGFFYSSINGNIDENEITGIYLHKSFKDLEDKEEIFDFRIEFDALDKADIFHVTSKEMQYYLSAEVKLNLLETQMDLYLPVLKDKNISPEKQESVNKILHDISKDYQILFDIVKEHKYNEKNKGKSNYLKD